MNKICISLRQQEMMGDLQNSIYDKAYIRMGIKASIHADAFFFCLLSHKNTRFKAFNERNRKNKGIFAKVWNLKVIYIRNFILFVMRWIMVGSK